MAALSFSTDRLQPGLVSYHILERTSWLLPVLDCFQFVQFVLQLSNQTLNVETALEWDSVRTDWISHRTFSWGRKALFDQTRLHVLSGKKGEVMEFSCQLVYDWRVRGVRVERLQDASVWSHCMKPHYKALGLHKQIPVVVFTSSSSLMLILSNTQNLPVP